MLVKQLLETIADVRKKRKEASWDQAVLKAQLFGMNPNTVAWKRSWRHGDIMSCYQQAFACTAAEAGGMGEDRRLNTCVAWMIMQTQRLLSGT